MPALFWSLELKSGNIHQTSITIRGPGQTRHWDHRCKLDCPGGVVFKRSYMAQN